MADKIFALTIPKWGLAMTEGTLTQWLVAEGERVAGGDVIAEIETAKIVNELEAETAGILRRHIASEGDILPVGSLIGVMADDDVSEQEISAFVAGFVPEGGELPAPESTSESKPILHNKASTTGEWIIPAVLKAGDAIVNKDILATPQAAKIAAKFNIDLSKITGTGRRGRISKADLIAAIENAGGTSGGRQVRRKLSAAEIRATPLAIRMAVLLNVDMSTVTPTGHRGRIRRADVEAAVKVIQSSTVPLPGPAAVALVARPDEAYEDVPLTAIRTQIARRLSLSKSMAPHFRVVMDIELDAILLLRQTLNKDNDGLTVSLNDIFVKTVALALVASPEVNIQFDGSTIRRFKDAHVAVAVALPDGLVTPVICHANVKTLREISREMADFTAKAKDGSLQLDDIEGGSFTVSNMGMFGVTQFDAIINPPQGAILALGAGILQKRLDDNGRDYSAHVMTATLSADHRVIDGAVAARFMQCLKTMIETPGTEIV